MVTLLRRTTNGGQHVVDDLLGFVIAIIAYVVVVVVAITGICSVLGGLLN